MPIFRTPIGWAVVVALALVVPATAAQADAPPLRESGPKVSAALHAVITEQIAAFHAGDFAKAYTFAAVEIRRKFSAAVFEKMVKIGYPILTRSISTEFGPALDDGENSVVYVRVAEAQGRQLFIYSLRREPAGWKIVAVSQREEDAPLPPEAPPKIPPLSA